MKFHWTKETAFPGFTCRDAAGNARAVVTGPNVHQFWYGQVFTRNLPDVGPFNTSGEAVAAVIIKMQELRLVPENSVFAVIPS